MDWDSSEECLFWAEPALTRQHFFQFLDDCPRGLLETENFGKLFFNFFRKSRASIGIRCFGTKCVGKVSQMLFVRHGLQQFRDCVCIFRGSHTSNKRRLTLLLFADRFKRAGS